MYIFNEYETNSFYFKLGNIQEQEFIDYINDFETIFEKNKNFKVIFDLSELYINDSLYSKKMITFIKDNVENTKKYLDKSALIISNKFIKNLINKLIFSIYKPVKPNIIVDSLNEAINYLNSEL